MTAVNKSLIKFIKWKLWAFKPIRRLTLHILLHKNIISSKIERLINLLSKFKIHEFSISNPNVQTFKTFLQDAITKFTSINIDLSKCGELFAANRLQNGGLCWVTKIL
jgi:hypothetical protein